MSPATTCSASRTAQQGRTIIELLIAMTIGLVIVIGVSALYLSSSGVSRTANQVSTIEQAGQLVLLVIGDSLKMAGYGEIRGSNFAGRSATLMDGAYLRGCTGTTFADPFPPYNGIPPLIQTPPDLTCSVPSAGDSLYVRFQAGPVIANMLPAEEDRIRLRDCLASTAAQDQEIDAGAFHPASGIPWPIVTNVFNRDAISGALECSGYAGPGFAALLNNVTDFKVFYKLDATGYSIGSGNFFNPAPMGDSVVDAAFINALPGPVDGWNHVVAVMVCVTVASAEDGVSVTGTALPISRCPVTAAEAEVGLNLTAVPPDGRVYRTFRQTFTVRANATASPSLTL